MTEAVRPLAAPLEDPFYYLRNMETVVRWVVEHHSDLLVAEESAQLTHYLHLPRPARALLARMLLRKGEHFRSDALQYTEIDDVRDALAELSRAGFVDLQPHCDAATLHRLCRVAELRQLLAGRATPVATNLKKSELLSHLSALESAGQTLEVWWPQAPFSLVALACQALFDRLRVMFFGNVYQDWSEFVLTELGHQHYEPVEFSPSSRAFRTRREVDAALALAACQQTLESSGDVRQALAILPSPIDSDWLAHRRDKVIFQLALQAERAGDSALAVALYRTSRLEEACIRRLRLLEKSAETSVLVAELERALSSCRLPLSKLHLQRIESRVMRRVNAASAPKQKPQIDCAQLCLPASAHSAGLRVEQAVVQHLSAQPGIKVFYVENALFPGLLGLLCWDELFTPLPGAFFHPFQAGPADLFRPDFVDRRREALAARLSSLDSLVYQSTIRTVWQHKYGTACRLVNWTALSDELLELALALIPAADLRQIFAHLLSDLRHHRSGMPDLIEFDTAAQSYRLIEVKGPGDRLQDHQTLWLQAFSAMGVEVSVLNVSYQPV